MQKKILVLVFIVLSQLLFSLPKALFVTTGDGDGRGTVSDGVILAMQELNKNGAITKLDNRKILYNPQKLENYKILILSTAFGYHDADRLYSLSYLSETEMKNISNWVKNGGILISDNFIGRNRFDGSDRINQNGVLDKNNWLLSKCFGVELSEKNMNNFQIVSANEKIWKGNITNKFAEDEWTTVVTNITSKDSEIWANWVKEDETYPAIIKSNFGKGKTVLLANFNLVHPASDGGFSSSEEIKHFYRKILNLAQEDYHYPISLHPWKNAKSSSFSISFNDDGSNDDYKRIINFLKTNNLKSNFFISNKISDERLALLRKSPNINLGLYSFSKPDFRKLSYSQTCYELQQNRAISPDAKGFRFPFTNNSYYGMLALEEENLLFDSSIGIDHLEFYRGSIFPYNLPIFSNGYYKNLDLLEISQILRDDWYFFNKILSDKPYDVEQQKNDARKFSAYLQSLWKRAILPNGGMMVISAHPLYSGYSEHTLKPLKDMLELAKKSDSWICSIDEIAIYWNKLLDLDLNVQETNNRVSITIHSNENIEGLTLLLPQKPNKLKYTGKYRIETKNDKVFLILTNAVNGEKITLYF